MRYSRLQRSLRRAGLVGGLGVVALVVSQGTGTAAPAADPAHQPAAVGCAWVPTMLPALPSGESAGINGTDGAGTWAGYAFEGGVGHAALWQGGQIVDLGTPLGGYSQANDVNRQGIAVGNSMDADGFPHAVMWRNGQVVRLAEPPGGSAEANAINDDGLIVGAGGSATGETPTHALAWPADAPDRYIDLGAVNGTSTYLYGVSERGVLAGTAVGNPSSAVTGTVRRGLRTLTGTTADAETFAYGAAGKYIVGNQSTTTTGGAVIWVSGRARLLPGQPFDTAHAVNADGLAVGNTDAGGAVWEGTQRTLLTASDGGTFTMALAVTDDGRVGGWSAPAGGLGQPTVWTCL
jgi:uncharacterized membrane protein